MKLPDRGNQTLNYCQLCCESMLRSRLRREFEVEIQSTPKANRSGGLNRSAVATIVSSASSNQWTGDKQSSSTVEEGSFIKPINLTTLVAPQPVSSFVFKFGYGEAIDVR